MIFYKSVTSGNDFIHIKESEYNQLFKRLSSEQIVSLCDRKIGIGADGLTLYHPTPHSIKFRIFNRDGSEAELSGNGMAGLAALLFDQNKYRSPITLDTIVGKRTVTMVEKLDGGFRQHVDLGIANFSNTRFFPFLKQDILEYQFDNLPFFPVSVGNPHAVFIFDQIDNEQKLIQLGEKITQSNMFPEGTNIEMVSPVGPDTYRVFFYERGVGPTISSTTGSAAVFSVLKRLKKITTHLSIETKGKSIVVSGKNKICIENFTKIVYKGIFKP